MHRTAEILLGAAIARPLGFALHLQESTCVHVDIAMPGITSSLTPALFLMSLTAYNKDRDKPAKHAAIPKMLSSMVYYC